eukprot:CAMPEP_0116871044 /NCGR_PEP_ID=MMETSP0463-20121206/1233_1 /TAXON_ID=181622 /ORGANISM="Strombidinopsis sp, Strain SopsisLIS2011" /LENGTH=126 /DNA_ID=CAMNT_0004508749 /DNA_START=453 /DNA_END=830 /DNA_ORIENTATION=-
MIRDLPVEGKTKMAATEIIDKQFKDKGLANFVSSNIVYDEKTNYKTVKWCINLDSIIDNIESIIGFKVESNESHDKLEPYTGKSFFINGEKSIKLEEEVYKKYFPSCEIFEIEGAGHYVHIDKAAT